MIIVLIRHGMTEGNVSRRYIGITDENLCPKGQEILNENIKNIIKGFLSGYEDYRITYM